MYLKGTASPLSSAWLALLTSPFPCPPPSTKHFSDHREKPEDQGGVATPTHLLSYRGSPHQTLKQLTHEEGEGAEIDGFQEYGRKAGLCCTHAPCVARATEIEPLVQASRSGPRGASPPECLPLSAGAREMVRARLCSSSCHLRPRGKNVRGENRQSMDAHCASGIASGTFSILYSHPTPTTCAHVHACTRTHTHTDTDTYEVGISLVVFLVEEMEP